MARRKSNNIFKFTNCTRKIFRPNNNTCVEYKFIYCTSFSGIMGKQVGENAFVVALRLARRMAAVRLYRESRRRLAARDASSTVTEAVTSRMGSGTCTSEIASL